LANAIISLVLRVSGVIIQNPRFILDVDPQFSDSVDADSFLEMLMAINGQQEIGNESPEDLHHEAIGAAGNQGIDVQVLFPPAKEFFDLPTELINQGNICGREVKAAGGHPIVFVVHPIPHDSHRPLSLLGSGGAQAHQGVIKHQAVLRDRVGFQAGLDRARPDAADKMTALLLPEVEYFMAPICKKLTGHCWGHAIIRRFSCPGLFPLLTPAALQVI